MSTISAKPIHLYNTLTRRKELFQPLHPPHVGIYNCGPTVYKDIHIGNLRTFTMTDWLRRMLEYNGYDVFLVRNITDVGHLHEEDDAERAGEDKLEHEARTTSRSAYEIANYYTEQYMHDVAELNILPPQLNPKATDHIPEMLTMTEKLVEQGLAYVKGENVYYDVSRFPLYGALSGNTIEQLRTGAGGRVSLETAEDKNAPEDFALWKHGEADRQMNWASPWGNGFPGWHIECSAMATKYLGEQFDIHTGAVDLIFPHHEDEIAQSQGVSGKQPVKYWMHGEFLDFGNSKMSRSVGNVLLLRDLKERGIDPLAFRYLLLTAHYRSKLNFTDESIAGAQNALNNFRADVAELAAVVKTGDINVAPTIGETGDINVAPTLQKPLSEAARSVQEAFHTAINDDLDLPIALSLARELARNSKIAPAERYRLLLDFDRVFGLRLASIEPKAAKAVSEEALALVRQRDEARTAKRWKESDQLRDQLKALGFEVRDTAKGTELG